MDEDTSYHGIVWVPRTVHNTVVRKNSLALASPVPDTADAGFQIHCLERGAYSAVLRAFCAQSNALSWCKEGLLTELRTELRVSDAEHREILMKVSSDESIKALREFGMVYNSHLTEVYPAFDPQTVVPGKKLKPGHVSTSASPICPPCAQRSPAPVQSISSLREFAMVNSTHMAEVDPAFDPHAVIPAKKFKPGYVSALASLNCSPSAQQSPAPVPTLLVTGLRDVLTTILLKPHLKDGKHCRDDWRGDNDLSHQVKVGHTPSAIHQDRHNQVNAGHASSPIDQNRQASNTRKAEVPVIQRSKIVLSRTGNLKSGSDIIKLRPTDKLIHEVEKLCGGENPNPANLETAKLILKDHEKDILDALCKLSDVSDGDDSPGEQRHRHGVIEAQMVGRRCHNTVY